MGMEINKNIRLLIEKLGITAYEFSRQIGNKRADNIYNIINERVEVSATTLNKIFEKYPEHKDFILYGDSSKNNQTIGDISNSTVVGANVNGNGITISYNDFAELIEVVKKRDEQIDKLIEIIKKLSHDK
jgi:plasmid maintenance system antidote protein VapI